MAVRVVLFDALGTLLELEPPAPIVRAHLAEAGHEFPLDVVAAALAEEMAYYRSRMHVGRDPEGLAALRAECGAELARALGAGAPDPGRATDILVRSLRFRLYADVLPAMDALAGMGMTLGVVSNWDCALPGHLAALGIRDRFAVVAASAVVGHAKPDPAIFRHALREIGAEPAEALHVGDRAREDQEGAIAAGLAAILLDRSPRPAPGPQVITSLVAVPGRVAGNDPCQ